MRGLSRLSVLSTVASVHASAQPGFEFAVVGFDDLDAVPFWMVLPSSQAAPPPAADAAEGTLQRARHRYEAVQGTAQARAIVGIDLADAKQMVWSPITTRKCWRVRLSVAGPGIWVPRWTGPPSVPRRKASPG